jgi:HPt (histidine-containing phosphotransfer) domain-containing protein
MSLPEIHPLLARCLRKAGIEHPSSPPGAVAWLALLALLSRAFDDLEADRDAMAMSSATGFGGVSGEPPADAVVLDMAVLDSIRGLGSPEQPDPVSELCAIFFDDMATRIGRIRRAISVGDVEDLVNQAHAIKGAAGNFGARRVAAVAQRLEIEAETEGGGASAELAAELAAELDRVRELVNDEVLGR